MGKVKQFKYQGKHINYIREIAEGNSYKTITELFNTKFKANLKHTAIKGVMGRYKIKNNRDARFKKDQTPWNKGKKTGGGPAHTLFKKGNIPKNYREIGSERIESKDGYTQVKIGDPNVWKHKHVLIWEKEHGKVPDGHVVLFGDGDKKNFDINNLICISRKQLLGLNRNNLIQKDSKLTKVAVKIVDLKYAISDRKKEGQNGENKN